MRSRGLVVAIAVVLAVLAAVGVIVYTSSVKENAVNENTVPVIVSSQDIPASTQLQPLIDQGVFTTANVPQSVVVADAVTTLDELSGKTATAPIYANEAIPLGRVTSTNVLGISPGNVGLGLEVQGQAAVNGSIQQGDNVVLWATFPRGSLVTKQSLKVLLTPAQLTKALQQALGGQASGSANPNVIQMQTDFTVTLVKSVQVLSAQNPAVDTSTGRSSSGASTFVLNMTPPDAQLTVFATGAATLYMGLLPPDNKDGYNQPGTVGVPYGRVVGVSK
jgi:Flp pilus assembly protein CpaB